MFFIVVDAFFKMDWGVSHTLRTLFSTFCLSEIIVSDNDLAVVSLEFKKTLKKIAYVTSLSRHIVRLPMVWLNEPFRLLNTAYWSKQRVIPTSELVGFFSATTPPLHIIFAMAQN